MLYLGRALVSVRRFVPNSVHRFSWHWTGPIKATRGPTGMGPLIHTRRCSAMTMVPEPRGKDDPPNLSSRRRRTRGPSLALRRWRLFVLETIAASLLILAAFELALRCASPLAVPGVATLVVLGLVIVGRDVRDGLRPKATERATGGPRRRTSGDTDYATGLGINGQQACSAMRPKPTLDRGVPRDPPERPTFAVREQQLTLDESDTHPL